MDLNTLFKKKYTQTHKKLVVIFKIYSLINSKSVDLDKAAAIENDETMIINSDHTIITTPVESPQTDIVESSSRKSAGPSSSTAGKLQIPSNAQSDETPSDASSCEAFFTVDKSKKRHKARSDSARITKYENYIIFVSVPFILLRTSNAIVCFFYTYLP